MEQKDYIVIKGAGENNLRGVDLKIPKNKLVVFTGLSGSGKSSLVFDTIAAESSRQLRETFPLYLRNRMPGYKRPKVDMIDGLQTSIVIDQRPFQGDIRSTVGTMIDAAPLLRLLFSRLASPRLDSSSAYSFNDPRGMCPVCGGIGRKVQFDMEKLLNKEKSLNEGAILFPGHQIDTYQWMMYANSGLVDPDKPLKDYTEKEWFDFLHGSGGVVEISNAKGKIWGSYNLKYEGFLDRITRLFLKRDVNTLNKTNQKIIHDFTSDIACPACHGARLNEAALESRLLGYNISEMGELEIGELANLLGQIKDPVGGPTAENLVRILKGVEELGLGYLNLNRPSKTLSGGETQRLKIVRHLGSALVGLTYIFDEPSAGLHPKDVERLNRLLLGLRDRGNTVLIVEHDKDVIRIADQVIDMGPKAGSGGGKVMFQGTYEELVESDTITARELGRVTDINRKPRRPAGFLTIENASLHNLKNVTVHIPKNALTVVSGIAGSGKSSLILGELVKRYPDAAHISQAPIGTSARSTPASYIGVMDEIRKLFAAANHVSASLFSYNSKGACPVCKGKGVVTTEMAFMDPVTVTCEACQGKRYNDEALSYLYKGKNILEALEMTIDEAVDFFEERKITSKLRTLQEVGMGYMTLGQPTDTLSGGECQRVKLAARLKTKNGIYLLDEPTTGLHAADTRLLMKLLNRIVDQGNTVIVVEHDPDVVKAADWIIDMGPGGGKNGGSVLFEGEPEKLLLIENSYTAKYLRAEQKRYAERR